MGSDGGDKEGPGRSACRSSTPRPLQFVNLTVPAARRQRWHDHRGRRPIPGRAKARSPRGAGQLTGLSEAQRRALALADNRIALSVVRRLVGYGRFDGGETARVMARLYAAARLLVNFFQPSFKLKEKRREGPPTATSTPESRLQCLPIDDELVQVDCLPSLLQLPNQRPRPVHDKDAAITSVLLLGHAGGLQGEVQPFCELSCMRLVVSPVGIVVIGDRPLPVAAINEQQRPMPAAVRSTGIVHWQQQEVGCIVITPIMDDAMEYA